MLPSFGVRRRARAATAVAASLVLLAALVPVATAAGGPSAQWSARSSVHLLRVGTTRIGAGSSTAAKASSGTANEFAPSLEVDQQIPHSGKVVHVAAAHVPTPSGNPVSALSDATGFVGISHLDQRNADGGNQFSTEPPDQGLCVGNGFVLEAVNLALTVYGTDGTLVSGPTALNPFFGLGHAIDRTQTPPVYGPFTADPRCYYDTDTQRWFVTIVEIDTDPGTGAFGSASRVMVAVSQSSAPTGAWLLYSLDTTLDGAGCSATNPCFGDQPLIGADANGFYITTNSFSITGTGFYGAQVYAFSKSALEAGSAVGGVRFDAGSAPTPDVGGIWYSLQPATSPDGSQFATTGNGTEYFLSALDFASTLDNRIAVWALTNTGSLAGDTPNLTLHVAVIGSEVYGFPPDAQQRMGATPLANLVRSPLELLAGNDDRMQQVVYADGKLWSGLNTVVQTPNGPTRVGAAYFIVEPSASGPLGATVAQQGYVSVNQANVIFPSIGVTAGGQGIMTFTLVGPDFYPSVAYVPVDATNGAGTVHIAAAGAGPDDGFSGYKAFGGRGTGRWGDYSAAVASGDTVWFASEYIPNSCPTVTDASCRTLYANWGTWVGQVTP